MAEPLTARCPLEGKCWRGACKKGSRNWAAKYHAEDLLPTVSPNHPRNHQEGSKMAPKMSQNRPKWGPWVDPGGIFGPLGCQKRLWERQVDAKMGPVGAKMGREEVKLGPSWGPMGPNWGQVGAKMPPGGAQKAPSGAPRGLFGSFLDHLGAKMLICWNTSVSYMKTSIPAGK